MLFQITSLFFKEKQLLLTDLQLYMNQSRGEEFEGPSLFIQEETIEEQLLLKTSQLHQSLRNRRKFHFEILQASIMKENIRKKCQQMQQLNRKLQDEEIQKEEELQQLKQQTRLYLQRISRQKQAKAIREQQIDSLNKNNRQLKIQLKRKVEAVNQLGGKDKENQSGIVNNHFISLQKLNLEANNLSKQQIINSLKQDIAIAQQKLKQKQQIRCQLNRQYEELLKEVQREQKKAGVSQFEAEKHIKNLELNEKVLYQIREATKKQNSNTKQRKLNKSNHPKQSICRYNFGQSALKAKVL